jgi:hypothetical protein
MSRWITPVRCERRSAERIWRTYSIAIATGAGPREWMSSLRLRPSRYSIAM